MTIFPGDYSDDHTWDDSWEDDPMLDDVILEEQKEMDMVADELTQQESIDKEKREKWLRNAEMPVRESIIDERGRSFGPGGRKRASASVWIQPGSGEVVVNRRHFLDYFPRMSDREHILMPLVVTDTIGKFDLQIVVKGGGITGQAGAARLGVANALNKYNPDLYRPVLKKLGMLTRDARKVERKKVGHVKARKSPQWVRR